MNLKNMTHLLLMIKLFKEMWIILFNFDVKK
jgi:hypothetical protein